MWYDIWSAVRCVVANGLFDGDRPSFSRDLYVLAFVYVRAYARMDVRVFARVCLRAFLCVCVCVCVYVGGFV